MILFGKNIKLERTSDYLQKFIEAEVVQRFVLIVIILNSIVIGLQTSDWVVGYCGNYLHLSDQIAVGIFVVELLIKIFVYRLRFFKNGWNIFDLVIVTFTFLPAGDGTSVIRTFRVLRVFRLLSVIPSMRLVVQAFLGAIPAMGSVVALLLLIFYVCSVMATMLFGDKFEDWFGTIGASSYSLFQIMTLESWSMGIVRPVMIEFPNSWLFFVPFILGTSFTVLNLFIAVIVTSIDEHKPETIEASKVSLDEIAEEIRTLRQEISELKKQN